MYDELDQLLKLTKCLEAEATHEDYDDDIPAAIPTYDEKGNPKGALLAKDGNDDESDKDEDDEDADDGKETNDDSDDGESSDREDIIGEQPADGQPNGCSGNVISKKNKGKRGPILERDGDDEKSYEAAFEDFGKATNDDDSDVQEEGLSMPSLKKSMKISLTDAIEMGMGHEFARKIKFEAANPLFVSNAPFKLGDVISAENNPMMYVVKNTDGEMITAAKPTNNQAEFCHCKDGCWPEYTFRQDEISPMKNASIDQLGNIAAFNDRFRGFDGTIEDRSPMDVAQDYAKQQTLEDISQNLDEILGQYQFAARGGNNDFCYTACSPKVMFKRPDGTVTTEQQMGGYRIKWGD